MDNVGLIIMFTGSFIQLITILKVGYNHMIRNLIYIVFIINAYISNDFIQLIAVVWFKSIHIVFHAK